MTCGTCQLPIRQIGNFNRWVHEADGSDDFDPPHSAAPADTPEPSTPPAQPPHTARAAAAGHPGTLDGPGVLGRALVDRWDDAWWHAGGDRWRWRTGREAVYRSRGELEAFGPVREVLLVDPADLQAAGRVLATARDLVGALRLVGAVGGPLSRPGRALAAAVDAYDRPTTGGEAAPKPTLNVHQAWGGSCLCEDKEAHDPDCRQGHRADCPADCWGAFGCPRRHRHGAVPAPEPASERVGAAYCVQTTDNDMQAFAELPDCPACEGSGKDLPPDWRTTPAEPAPLDLTSSAATRVVEWAIRWREVDRKLGTTRESSVLNELAFVVDLLVGNRPAEPAPEPAGDGPGWDRERMTELIAEARRRDPMDDAPDQVEALLAHFDLMNEHTDRQLKAAEGYVRRAEDRADAARAELAEALNDVDDRDTTIGTLRDDLNHQTGAAFDNQAEADRLRIELATARRDAAADALEWAADQSVCAAINTDAPGTAEERMSLHAWAAEVRSGERSIPETKGADRG